VTERQHDRRPDAAAGARISTPTVRGNHVEALQRLRWAVRAVLILGVVASIAANVLHARPNLISQAISAWPPLALLLTVELISRVPAHRRTLAVARLLATAVIAGIAAWVSYWHMAVVTARYGETGTGAAYLLPVSVDGLVVVASISLVEISGRIHTVQTAGQLDIGHRPPPTTNQQQQLAPTPTAGTAAAEPPASTATTPAPTSLSQPFAVSAEQNHTTPDDGDPDQQPSVDENGGSEMCAAASEDRATPSAPDDRIDGHLAGSDIEQDSGAAEQSLDAKRQPARAGRVSLEAHAPSPQDRSAATASSTSSAAQRDQAPESPGSSIGADNTYDDTMAPSETAAAVAYWYRRDPKLHPAQIATRIGRSERTVRRYWPPTTRPTDGRNASHPADRLQLS
jgi:hypothetical protein